MLRWRPVPRAGVARMPPRRGPSRAPQPRGAAIAALVALAITAAPAPPAGHAGRPGALTAAETQALMARIRATFYVPSPLPPLGIEVRSRFRPAPGVEAERITYGTEFGMRVPAILYLPDPAPRAMPGLVIVAGHGGDKYSWYSYYAGMLYARAGAAVLTYDTIGEGERNAERKSGANAHDHWLLPEPQMARRLAGLMLTDAMQGARVLRHRAGVDPGRIAIAGYSMGSFVESLACAVDPRFHACVAAGGGDLDGRGGYWDSHSNKPMCQEIPYRSLDFLGDRGAVLYALQASHAASLVFNGAEDRVVQIPTHGAPFFRDLQRRAARLHGGAAGVFEFAFGANGGHRPWFVTRPVALWLDAQLRFPNWSPAAIRAMPAVRAADWARAAGAVLARGAGGERREGGTRALAPIAFPALSRAQLSVFAPDAWQRRETALIYEMWVAHAEAAAAQPGPRNLPVPPAGGSRSPAPAR
ncbi:MAG TPA: acetylxylan esterase [Terriglobales bacterium]|nr:acetylxylan esterase [Terriglobales bacterium]